MGTNDLNPYPIVILPNTKAIGNLGIKYTGSTLVKSLVGVIGIVFS